MARIQRANVILDVDDDRVIDYLDKGYNVINEDGEVIRSGVPNDLNQLRQLYCAQLEEIKSLKAEIKSLKGNKKEAEPKKKKSAD